MSNWISKNSKMDIISSVLMLTAVCLYPPIFLYTQNAETASITDITTPLFLFISLGLTFAAVGVAITKSFIKPCLFSAVFMLAFMNYSYLEQAVAYIGPSFRYWHIMPLTLLIIAHIGYFIFKKQSLETGRNLVKIIGIVVSALILFNFVLSVPVIMRKTQMTKEPISQAGTNAAVTEPALPNIYFLIIDSYASLNQVGEQYGYDNSAFVSHLENLGFNSSHSSLNPQKATSTSSVITNLLHLEYVAEDDMPEYERKALRENNRLFPLLEKYGYKPFSFGAVGYYGISNDDTVKMAKTEEGLTVTDFLLNNTMLYPFVKKSITKDAMAMVSEFDTVGSDIFPPNNTFVVLHSMITHVPYLFTKDGNLLQTGSIYDVHDPEIYLGGYIYATNLISETVGNIIKRDPDSIIILQSDHGAPLGSKLQNFNAVYYRGEELDIEGLTNINTLRVVLNNLLDVDLDMVEVPEAMMNT